MLEEVVVGQETELLAAAVGQEAAGMVLTIQIALGMQERQIVDLVVVE
jgi:hypothetical protein